MKLLGLGISSVKPMSPTKMATIENLFKTMSGFLKEIDEIEKKSQGNNQFDVSQTHAFAPGYPMQAQQKKGQQETGQQTLKKVSGQSEN